MAPAPAYIRANPALCGAPPVPTAQVPVSPIESPSAARSAEPARQGLEGLAAQLAPLRARLIAHPLYTQLETLEHVRVFMQHHVFAVWDFMSLLKALQRELTSVELPWRPRGDGTARRLINEIVLGEESDEGLGGQGYSSHFELYRAAMEQCGASVGPIDALFEALDSGAGLRQALERSGAPAAARAFVGETFALIEDGPLPAVAAAFTLGREDVIPDMFTRLVGDLSRQHGGRLSRLIDYLERHIQMDGERHGPMSAQLLAGLCGQDPLRWSAAQSGAERAIRARLALWDGILAALKRG